MDVKPGDRIVLVYMGDDPDPIEPGTEGTVEFIDGMGDIHVDWDNGRTLALVPYVDRFEVIGSLSVASDSDWDGEDVAMVYCNDGSEGRAFFIRERIEIGKYEIQEDVGGESVEVDIRDILDEELVKLKFMAVCKDHFGFVPDDVEIVVPNSERHGGVGADSGSAGSRIAGVRDDLRIEVGGVGDYWSPMSLGVGLTEDALVDSFYSGYDFIPFLYGDHWMVLSLVPYRRHGDSYSRIEDRDGVSNPPAAYDWDVLLLSVDGRHSVDRNGGQKVSIDTLVSDFNSSYPGADFGAPSSCGFDMYGWMEGILPPVPGVEREEPDELEFGGTLSASSGYPVEDGRSYQFGFGIPGVGYGSIYFNGFDKFVYNDEHLRSQGYPVLIGSYDICYVGDGGRQTVGEVFPVMMEWLSGHGVDSHSLLECFDAADIEWRAETGGSLRDDIVVSSRIAGAIDVECSKSDVAWVNWPSGEQVENGTLSTSGGEFYAEFDEGTWWFYDPEGTLLDRWEDSEPMARDQLQDVLEELAVDPETGDAYDVYEFYVM